jgi:hypothetical protein
MMLPPPLLLLIACKCSGSAGLGAEGLRSRKRDNR